MDLTIVVHRQRHALTLSNLRHGVLMRGLGLTDANEGSHKYSSDPLDVFARSGCLNLRSNGCATKLWIDLRKHGTANVDFRAEGERLVLLVHKAVAFPAVDHLLHDLGWVANALRLLGHSTRRGSLRTCHQL